MYVHKYTLYVVYSMYAQILHNWWIWQLLSLSWQITLLTYTRAADIWYSKNEFVTIVKPQQSELYTAL